jgi:hypothetical protein
MINTKVTFELLDSCEIELFNKHAPIKSLHFIQYPQRKFLSNPTKIPIKCRDNLYQNIKRIGITEPNPELKFINKQIQKAVRDDTKSKLNLKIMKTNVWSGLKKLFPTATNASNVFDNFTPDDINDFFVSISIPEQSSSLQPLPTMPGSFINHHRRLFKFHHIQEDELLRAWKRTKNKLSGSEDIHGFSPAMLNHLIQSHSGRAIITNFFNHCITDSLFPDALKVAKIVPVPKTNSPSSPSEFRPVSILPNLSKGLEKCLFSQFSNHLGKNNMLSPHQFRFQKNHSTVHACTVLADLLYLNRDKNFV